MPDRPIALQPYLVNLATPNDVPTMRFYVQNELQQVTNGISGGLETIIESLVDSETGNYTDFVHWSGPWASKFYRFNDMVLDGGWTMICINEDGTTDKAAPEDTGIEQWITDGIGGLTFVGDTDSGTVYITGQNYNNWPQGYIQAIRFWTPENSGDFSYEVWYRDNLRTRQLIAAFVPTVVGWQTFNYARLIAPGTSFDVFVVVRSVTMANSFNGFWQTKNENGNPGEGEANFQNDETIIRVSNIDENDVDQETNLGLVETGGTLSFAGLTWTITLVDIRGSHVRYTLTPNLGRPEEDKYTLSFSWGSTDPVPFVRDANFYSGTAQISGYEGSSLGSLTTTQDAYGIDLLVTPATVSPDWDIVSPSAFSAIQAVANGNL